MTHYSIRMNSAGVKEGVNAGVKARIAESRKAVDEFSGEIHIRSANQLLKRQCDKVIVARYDTTSLRAKPRKARAKSTSA